jgi:hypothetical protein
MQFVGKFRSVGDFGAKVAIQSLNPTCMETADGFGRCQFAKALLVKWQQAQKQNDRDQHPEPGDML